MSEKKAQDSIRLLKFLQTAGTVTHQPFAGAQKNMILLSSQSGKRHLSKLETLDNLHKASLVQAVERSYSISKLGKMHLARALNASDVNDLEGFRAQHRKLERRTEKINGVEQSVMVNAKESPLGRLMAIKTKTGGPWLETEAFNAAEKLRIDFTKGQFMQRVTSSWDPTSGSKNSRSSAGGMTDLSDLAIDARQRVEHALQTVGPELAGVLTDVCCYLKGLQVVERERNWPPRSAKLMLRVALNLLARHYGGAVNSNRPIS